MRFVQPHMNNELQFVVLPIADVTIHLQYVFVRVALLILIILQRRLKL